MFGKIMTRYGDGNRREQGQLLALEKGKEEEQRENRRRKIAVVLPAAASATG